MKYEVGFVIPELMDYVEMYRLHLPDIRFTEVRDYDTDQLLQYAALRKQCLDKNKEVNVSIRLSDCSSEESIEKNIFAPLKALSLILRDNLGYDSDGVSLLPQRVPPQYKESKGYLPGELSEGYVDDIDRNSMYIAYPICETLRPSFEKEHFARISQERIKSRKKE